MLCISSRPLLGLILLILACVCMFLCVLFHAIYISQFLGIMPYGVLPLSDDRRRDRGRSSQSEAVIYVENGST